MNTPRHPHHVRGGWSLIELGIVVLIITILLAILINTFGESKGPVEATKVTLRALAGIATEFEVAMTPAGSGELVLPRHDMGTANNSTSPSIERFVRGVWQLERARTLLQGLGRDVAKIPADPIAAGARSDILDGWGINIRYHDGRNAPEAGMRKYRGAYFASAGPDGKWGTFNATTMAPDNDAKDNMFSFDLK
jgi:type II secretory pathway pseudopilin PulG